MKLDSNEVGLDGAPYMYADVQLFLWELNEPDERTKSIRDEFKMRREIGFHGI